MRKLISTLATLALAIGIAGTASASPDGPKRVDRREAKQQTRIVRGVKSGELTRREVIKLEKGQARVHRVEQKAKSDGKVSAKERAKLERVQDHQSKRIHRQKHDAQTRR